MAANVAHTRFARQNPEAPVTTAGNTYYPRQPFPTPLDSGTAWHYTNAEALHGIWGGDEIWASAIRVLNDANEVTFGIKAIRDSWCVRRGGETNTHALDFIDKTIDAVEESAQVLTAQTFVISASLDGDLLNQWMHYGGKDGYALGLTIDAQWGAKIRLDTPTATHGALPPIHSGWYKVEYLAEEQGQLITNAIDWIITNHQSVMSSAEGVAFSRYVLSTVAVLLKHEAFEAEKEVRFVCGVSESESEMIRYRVSSGQFVPYISVDSTKQARAIGTPTALEIHKIRCGPNVPKVTVEVLRDMTHLGGGYPVISQSTIPLVGRT
jgi:hypothetical protein